MLSDGSSKILIASARRNLLDTISSSDTKQADRCTQNFIDLVPTKRQDAHQVVRVVDSAVYPVASCGD